MHGLWDVLWFAWIHQPKVHAVIDFHLLSFCFLFCFLKFGRERIRRLLKAASCWLAMFPDFLTAVVFQHQLKT